MTNDEINKDAYEFFVEYAKEGAIESKFFQERLEYDDILDAYLQQFLNEDKNMNYIETKELERKERVF